MNQAVRLARPVLIGFGGAAAVWGTVFALQQRAAVTSGSQPVHLSAEWALDTKAYVTRAAGAFTAQQRIAAYEKALNTLVSRGTDVKTKSADWLTGYADLLRALGVAFYDAGKPDDAQEALTASLSIPLGSAGLQHEAAVTLFWLSRGTEPHYLLEAAQARSLDAVRPASAFATEQEVRAFVPLYLEAAKLLVSGRQYAAGLASLVAVHKAVAVSPSEDPLCYKPAAGGYIGQVLWQLGRREEAVLWLRKSEADAAMCRTPACKDTRATLHALLAKAGSP